MHRFTRVPILTASCILFLCLGLWRPARGWEPNPPSGQARLSDGRVVDYKFDYNRNSIQHSVRVHGGFIASTPSGALLKFESPSMRLVKESILDQAVSALGHGQNGEPLAGFPDGRICRVDPVSLELTERFKLPSEPERIIWAEAVGTRPAGLVVVVESRKTVRYSSEVHDLATGKVYPLERGASACHLDRSGRLWLGWDSGEWGGGIVRIDLDKANMTSIPPPPSADPKQKPYWSGIYGFIELRDGQIWAHGGTSHMGFNSGFITRIDEAAPRWLFTFHFPDKPFDPEHLERQQEPDPDRPWMPLTHLVEQDDHILVFSYDDVYRVDKDLKIWKREATLDLEYKWGRPDAVGAYPSINLVYPPTRPGEPFVFATMADGFVELKGDKALSHALPGQVDPVEIDDVTNSAEGLLLRNRFDLRETEVMTFWKLGKEGWLTVDFSPPFEMDPAHPEPEIEEDEKYWTSACVLVDPAGKIFTVNQSCVRPGTLTVALWTDGKPVRMGREVTEIDCVTSFITGDGELWNDSSGGLFRFRNGKWEVTAGNLDTPGRVKPIPSKGPPWILLAPWRKALWRLDYGADGKKTTLVKLTIAEGADELEILDAIPWTNDLLLLATGAGLRSYDPAKGKLAKVDLPEPPKPAAKLARDRVGRLWLGSDKGLWLSEAGAKGVESLDAVPALKGARIDALAADPERSDGVIAVVQDRGVYFLRAKEEP